MSVAPRHGMIIHFGMHKTGTSSIQESLFRGLSDPRFYYVNFGMPNASNGVTMCFRTDLERYGPVRKSGVRQRKLAALKGDALERFASELEASGARIAVISGEHIGKLSASELRSMQEFLKARGRDDLAPIAYVRRPKEYMESAFQQRVRNGLGALVAERLFPEYRERFAKFDAAFGRDRVQLALFDTGSFPGGCVVRDFCTRASIDFKAEDVVRVNEAISLPALSLLYTYRKLGPGFGVGPRVLLENKLLVNELRTLPGPKVRLHSSLVGPVIDARREEIAWMEARLGVSLKEDIAAQDDGAIRSEEDLLKYAPETLRWLGEKLGADHAARWRPDMAPSEVAEWMHALRLKLAPVTPKAAERGRGRHGDKPRLQRAI